MRSLVQFLRPYAEFILPLAFFGFFLAAGLAIYYRRNRRVVTSFLAGFLVVMLLFQTVMPVVVTPFMNWHKFSNPREPTEVRHEIRVVDADGNELRYDNEATLAFNGVRMSALHRQMREEYSEERNREVARFLLERAREYRTQVERGTPRRGATWTEEGVRPSRAIRFPAHGHTSTWTADQLSEYSEFVGIRLYRMEVVTSEDGTEVVSYTERRLFEHYSTENPDRDRRSSGDLDPENDAGEGIRTDVR